MSEVENHYAGGSDPEALKGGSASTARKKPAGAAEMAKAALDQASSSARSTLKAAQDGAGDALGQASDWASGGYDKVSRTVQGARRTSAKQISRQGEVVSRYIEENPIMVGVIGLAAGLLVGALLPGTRRENRAFGRYADEVREQGLRYARELAEQGRDLVKDTLDLQGDGQGEGEEGPASGHGGPASGHVQGGQTQTGGHQGGSFQGA